MQLLELALFAVFTLLLRVLWTVSGKLDPAAQRLVGSCTITAAVCSGVWLMVQGSTSKRHSLPGTVLVLKGASTHHSPALCQRHRFRAWASNRLMRPGAWSGCMSPAAWLEGSAKGHPADAWAPGDCLGASQQPDASQQPSAAQSRMVTGAAPFPPLLGGVRWARHRQEHAAVYAPRLARTRVAVKASSAALGHDA